MEKNYFLNKAGKILGPFDMQEIRALANDGQIVSTDSIRKANGPWVPVSNVKGLIAPAPTLPPFSANVSPVPMEENWYTRKGEQTFGPYSKKIITELIKSSEITASNLVWKEGMPEWKTVAQIPALFLQIPSQSSANISRHKSQKARSHSQEFTNTTELKNTIAPEFPKFFTLLTCAIVGGVAIILGVLILIISTFASIGSRPSISKGKMSAENVLTIQEKLRKDNEKGNKLHLHDQGFPENDAFYKNSIIMQGDKVIDFFDNDDKYLGKTMVFTGTWRSQSPIRVVENTTCHISTDSRPIKRFLVHIQSNYEKAEFKSIPNLPNIESGDDIEIKVYFDTEERRFKLVNIRRRRM